VELASHLTAPNGPYSKRQVARALSFARSSYYVPHSRPRKIRRSRWRSKREPDQDDTLGHRKLAALLHLGKNRIKRVMQKYGLTARRKKKRYVYPGKAAQIVPNLVRELAEDAASEVVFSDIFEIQLADGSKVRGCFADVGSARARF
jgi:putative transposase